MSLLPLLSCKITVPLTWQVFSLQGETRAHKGVSAVGYSWKDREGNFGKGMLGKVEITLQMMRKIPEQALYGCEKSLANSGSDSHGVSPCHRRRQAKFNGVLALGMGPVRKWDCRTWKSDWSTRRGKAISSVKGPSDLGPCWLFATVCF